MNITNEKETSRKAKAETNLILNRAKANGGFSQEDISELYTINKGFIFYCMNEFKKRTHFEKSTTIDDSDLLSEATLGFLEGIEKFNFDTLVSEEYNSFSTFVKILIDKHLFDLIHQNGYFPLSRKERALYNEIQNFEEEYLQKYGEQPSYEEIALALGCNVKDVIGVLEIVDSNKTMVELDKPSRDDRDLYEKYSSDAFNDADSYLDSDGYANEEALELEPDLDIVEDEASMQNFTENMDSEGYMLKFRRKRLELMREAINSFKDTLRDENKLIFEIFSATDLDIKNKCAEYGIPYIYGYGLYKKELEPKFKNSESYKKFLQKKEALNEEYI